MKQNRRREKTHILYLAIVAVVSAVLGASLFVYSNLHEASFTDNSSAIFPPISPSLALSEIKRGDTSKKQVIFTFDAGGSAASADSVLKALANHRIKGTFFLTGKFVEKYTDVVLKIAAAGNEIFNHTYDHEDLTTLSRAAVQNELIRMQKALAGRVAVSPRPYFRTPYSAENRVVLLAAGQIGYRSVEYTMDAMDWRENSGETASAVEKRILENINPGEIFLMHIGDNITGRIIDDVFTKIEARGYKIVSLTQGL